MNAKNTICLWYDGSAEEAARFYAETFPDSAVGAVYRAPGDYPSGKQGGVLTVEFTVLGIPCLGINGGPAFKHSEAFSFQVATDDQAETDRLWNAIVGNVVGSNTFNILGCLGLSGLASGAPGLTMPPSLLAFDIWVMLAVALACLPVFVSGRVIARWEGAVFVLYYAAYVAYLVLAAQQHDALGPFSSVMLGFVLPITVITLVVVLLRRGPATRDGP